MIKASTIILITIIFFLVNYIIFIKKGSKESFTNQKAYSIYNEKKPEEYYKGDLETEINYNKLSEDVKDELLEMYPIYKSEKLKSFNENTKQYNLAEDYPTV